MSPRTISLVARKEVRDALRNRWFLLFALAFAALALALSRLSLGSGGTAGYAGYGRTAASLVNLVLLIVPLMGLTLGGASLAAEREHGTLATLLAQPLSRSEVLLGKYVGLALALAAALSLGFGLTAAILAFGGAPVDATTYAALVGYTLLLAAASLSIGFLVSSLSRGVGAAMGAALFLWLFLVFLGDLGLMGTAVTLRLQPSTLLSSALLNPLEAFRIAAIGALTGTLDVLGPVGAYATRRLGAWLPPTLVAALGAWALFPLLLAAVVFSRRSLT